MKKKTQPLSASAVDSDFKGNDERVALERSSFADLNDPSFLDLTRVLKELEADTQAMLNDIWSDDNDRIEKLLTALDEDDEEDEKLVKKLLAELNEEYEF